MKLVCLTHSKENIIWVFKEWNKDPLIEFRKLLIHDNIISTKDLCNLEKENTPIEFNSTLFQYIVDYSCNVHYPQEYELEIVTRNVNLFGI